MQETMSDTSASAAAGKHFRERTLRNLKLSLGRLWKRRSVTITEYDPTYKVAYLGNVLTGWAKGEGCVEKPLSTLWKNYTGSCKPDVPMKLTVSQAGLKAVTKEHGLTEYWSHRVTYCAAPSSFPRVFCWVYRHEGRKLKQELRCHAVLCSKEAVARRMASQLRARLSQALSEFKRDKVCRQNARLSLANCVYENPSLPRRKILLSTGSHNYRPPLERSKSAPKLGAIEEEEEPEERVTWDLLMLDAQSDAGSSSLQSVSSDGSTTAKPEPPPPEPECECGRVDWRPSGRHIDPLRRSVTFPPPAVLDLDSLSEEDEVDPDAVSDESGYAELMDGAADSQTSSTTTTTSRSVPV